MASNASYLDVCSLVFHKSVVLHRFSSANVTLSLCKPHEDDALLLLCLVDPICYGLLLFSGVGVISTGLGLANGLDDPMAPRTLFRDRDRELIRESALLVFRPLFWL